ncbi:uncharacterized protein RAG0_16080 [Rhynchosporium agropyri]|uniref:Uncharacterized protein n=1 Tax=Rhynchosporium agropyri TaxID=914238 RepID=A0A1E1LNR9_9HELO|nr:uncharacterized protein RAG0_16080 [Rhynchosporium agropyri]
MTSQEMPAELQGGPVSWWSDPITLGIPFSINTIRLDILDHRGWTLRVRLCLSQGGQIYPAIIYVMNVVSLQVLLTDLGHVNFYADFAPCVSFQFEFEEGFGEETGLPWVVIYPQQPVFTIPPIVPIRLPPWAPTAHDPRYFVHPDGNQIETRASGFRI